MRIAHLFIIDYEDYLIPFDNYIYDAEIGTLTFYLEHQTTALFKISYVKYFTTFSNLDENEIKTDLGNHAARDNVL